MKTKKCFCSQENGSWKNVSNLLFNRIHFNHSTKLGAYQTDFSIEHFFLSHYLNFSALPRPMITHYNSKQEDPFDFNYDSFFGKIALLLIIRKNLQMLDGETKKIKNIERNETFSIFEETKIVKFIKSFEHSFLKPQIIEEISQLGKNNNCLSFLIEEHVLENLEKEPSKDLEFEHKIQIALKCPNDRNKVLIQIIENLMKFKSIADVFNQLIYVIIVNFFLFLYKAENNSFKDLKTFLNDFIKTTANATKDLSQELQKTYNVFLKGFSKSLSSILDGEASNVLFFNNLSTKSQVFNLMNPTLLALSYFSQTLKTLENKKGFIYNDKNLPKITFINFDGYDNDLNLDIFRNFTKKQQYISIYLDDNEEFNITDQILERLNEKEEQKRAIFVPLRSKKFGNDKKIKGKDFVYIFENVVHPLIRNFNPSVIVMSHSFTFSDSFEKSEHKFNLSPKKFSIILKNLCKLSNYRIILVPRLSFQKKNLISKESFFEKQSNKEESNLILQNKFSFELKNWLDNRNYLYECFGGFLNVTYRNPYFPISVDQREKLINPLMIEYISNLIKKVYLPNGFIRSIIKKKNVKERAKLIEKINISKGILNNYEENFNFKGSQEKIAWKEKQDIMIEENNFFSCTINIIEEIEGKTEVFRLFHKENNEFYYTKECRYLVAYDMKEIYFFNVFFQNAFHNYKFRFNFNNLDLYAIEIKNYPKEIQKGLFLETNYVNLEKLEEFSICYEKSQAIYLIWGKWRLSNENLDKKTEFLLNPFIFKYFCKNNQWEKIELVSSSKIPIVPRLKVSSCFFQRKHDKSIFLFSGFGMNDSYFNNIYNIMEKIEYNEKTNCWIYKKIPKSSYNMPYKPLINSVAIYLNELNIEKNTSINSIMLIGGSSNSYINPKRNHELEVLTINFDEDSNKVEITKNNLTEENEKIMNIYFCTQNINYFLDKNSKKIIFVSQFVPKEKRGLLLDLYNSNKMDLKCAITWKRLKNRDKNKTRIVISPEINFNSKEKNIKMKEIQAFDDQIIPKIEVKTLDLIKAFQNYSFNVYCNEKKSELFIFSKESNEMINFIKLEFRCFNNFIRTSKHLKSSSFCLNKNKIFILLNNESETRGKRIIYGLDLNHPENLNKNHVLAKPILEEFMNFNIVDSSIYCEEETLFCFGGSISDTFKQNELEKGREFLDNASFVFQTNFYWDHMNNNYFKSNLAEMRNPFITKCNNRFIVINPSIINKIKKISFFDLSKKPKYFKEFCDTKGSFIYGESIDDKFTEEWIPFIINLNEFNLLRSQKFIEKPKNGYSITEESNSLNSKKKYKGKLRHFKSTKNFSFFMIPFENKNESSPRFLKNQIRFEMIKINQEKIISAILLNKQELLIASFSLNEELDYKMKEMLLPVRDECSERLISEEEVLEYYLIFEDFEPKNVKNFRRLKNIICHHNQIN